jgi:hypothetical protein
MRLRLRLRLIRVKLVALYTREKPNRYRYNKLYFAAYIIF